MEETLILGPRAGFAPFLLHGVLTSFDPMVRQTIGSGLNPGTLPTLKK